MNSPAVLFVDANGPYPKLTECWYDEARDATTYAGAGPVVAHPPCAPWGRMRHMNRYQKAEHAIHALSIVRALGGVLEHPAGSQLWNHAGLPKPGAPADQFGGWTLEVDQVRWGHVARKRTWLYIVGVTPASVPEIPPDSAPTHWCNGGRVTRPDGRKVTLVPQGIKLCSAQQRRRTPPAFAAWLLDLASRVRL